MNYLACGLDVLVQYFKAFAPFFFSFMIGILMLLANKNGKQIERGEMYKVVYSHRDGTALNEIAEANIDGTSKDEEDNSNNNKAVENSLEGDSKED
ncbi:uncharacterized protein LOC112012069 isoform X2 [Quercus suber]|uniref:uncharacterized protein LOC112012069 isoform X2 n=1 Tax=Quercus suber TaxID=58331 RepID=UPI0032DFB947